MYKTFLILISLTLSLTSCYTQFSAGNTSKPYIPDVQQYNYDDETDYESSDYYEGQYEPTNETEYNVYYGSPWYSDYYYYPSWGFYTGWYSPYYSPGFICYPAYPDYCWNDGGYYTPIERTPRSFNKGRANRDIPKKKRKPRHYSVGNKTLGNETTFTDLSSGNVIAVISGHSGNTQDISSSSNSGNKGHVIAAVSSKGHQNRPKSKTVSTATKRSKKRIYYTPGRSTSKSTARRGVGSASKSSGKRRSGSHSSYSSAVRSGGSASSHLSSRSGSSSSVRRSSSSSVSRSSSSSSSRASSSASKVSSRSRRHR